ncbi:MAG: hypothetical protein WCW44_01275 [archaeon]|jgi:hypothetical protein
MMLFADGEPIQVNDDSKTQFIKGAVCPQKKGYVPSSTSSAGQKSFTWVG